MSSRSAEERLKDWVPRTRVGKLVFEGRIASLEELFAEGYKIREPEMADVLVPKLQEEVLSINMVQRQTDAGEKTRFRALVAVGNGDGVLGIGSGKARHIRVAIDKAAMDARMNVIIVRRGCGSWECGCGKPHSLPFRVEGKCGAVRIVLLPGPRGLGLVAGELGKTILRLAGIEDCWTRAYGPTHTATSYALAMFNALRKAYEIMIPEDWV